MEFQLSYFKSWKMMLWNCCTQYASKFGKLSSGHRTEKGQFSFQSQRKTVPKNVQTTVQLHSFHMMYSAYKFNRQGDNIQPWCTAFPIWNQSVVPCPALTVTSWPAYRFLRRQVKWPGISISWRIFQFVVIHTAKGFGIVNKAEVDVFWTCLAFSMIQWMLGTWSLFLCLF